MADVAGSPKPATSPRPTFTTSMRSSSYLSDHQQYRPPIAINDHHGIDAVLEDLSISKSASPQSKPLFNGIPSDQDPPKIVDSGITHSFSHQNCAPSTGDKTDRLIATLFYKPSNSRPRTSSEARSAQSPAKPRASESSDSLPSNMAPTNNINAFPLEPPTQQFEPLDHLYGSYITPMCISSFLHLMSTFPMPDDCEEPHSSHRCLDNPDTPRVVELTLSPAPWPKYLNLSDLRKHELIYRFEQEWNVDVTLQRDSVWRRHPRLVVFDMDSTLIEQEVIDLLAQTITDPPGLSEKVADITHRAMVGELEFEAAFKERVKLLTGLPATVFDELRDKLNITRGVRDLLKALRRLGVKTAVLSGGFLPLTSWLASELGLQHAHANEVVIEDGKLTGEVQGMIVGKERKRDLLVEIAAQEGVDLSQAVAVGDGANDLLMLGTAGLGVAWNAKARVQMEAGARLNGESILDLLYLFGFTEEEIRALVA